MYTIHIIHGGKPDTTLATYTDLRHAVQHASRRWDRQVRRTADGCWYSSRTRSWHPHLAVALTRDAARS